MVIATCDRPEGLRRALDGLARQTVGAEQFEVVVVDDGPTVRAVVPPGVAVVLNRGPRGPGAARNRGWAAARAELVAFCDDDCVPDERWLETLLAAADEHPGALLQGRTLPAGDRQPLLWEHSVRVEALGPQFQTCNILYPRAVLERLGGFDESFGTHAGEDTHLAWRAIEAGVPTVFVSGALVRHAVVRRGRRATLRSARRRTGTIRVLADHPGARQILWRRLFWNVWHYLLLRSVAATAGPAWLRRMVWTWHLLELRARARRSGAGTAAVPFLLAHDVIETIAVVRGAIRYRTLVL